LPPLLILQCPHEDAKLSGETAHAHREEGGGHGWVTRTPKPLHAWKAHVAL